MRCNLIIMMCVWATTCASYYIINYNLRYLEGDIFLNTTVAICTELFSIMIAGFFSI